MDWRHTRTARITATFDPEGLSRAQCEGDACVTCHKRWPRPRVRIGRLPDDSPLFACDDCAGALIQETEENLYHLPRRAAFF
ncbi:hypothetical protein [Streptosporangium saharense]|uniref:hypothetical protein n=1 Tax=Streptosporangium saharense TaxID=1706840 RepID=UPI00344881AD